MRPLLRGQGRHFDPQGSSSTVLPVGVLGGRGQRYSITCSLSVTPVLRLHPGPAESEAWGWPALSVTAPSSGTSGPWKPQHQLRSVVVWALSRLSLKATDSCLSAGPSPAGRSLGMSILGLPIQTHPEPQTLAKATHTQVVRKKTSGNLVWEGGWSGLSAPLASPSFPCSPSPPLHDFHAV